MPRTGTPATRHVAAVERALGLLEALAEEHGLFEHVPTSGRYRLGIRLVHLGRAALGGLDVREIARPHLSALAAVTGETATLSLPGDPDAVTVDFVLSSFSVQSVAQIGRPSVAHATAAGKVLLAFGGVDLPKEPLAAYTRRTITSSDALAREVERVRSRGWARAVREREDDLSALAAPAFSAQGELAAILGVQGPAERFDRIALRDALDLLLERAAAVSHALGWNPTNQEGA